MTANYSEAVTPEALGKRLSPFVRHLLKMDNRIRLCPLYGDVEEDKGFFVTKDHIIIPYELPRVEHDIAHMVEMKNPIRWTMPDWGMPRFEADVIKPGQFFAAFAREVRTRAIQLHIEPEFYGNDEHTSFNQLANPYWSSMVKKLIPFGRFKSYQDVEVWMAGMRERTHKTWSMERIHHEWKVRLNHIQNWMETSKASTRAA